MNVSAGNSRVHRAGPMNVFRQYTAKCGKVAPHRLLDTDAEANCKACEAVDAERDVPAAKSPTKRGELVAAVRAHATANYSNGWDAVVECYDDEEIAKVIGRARTIKGALAKFAPIIEARADRRAEADYQIEQAVGAPSANRRSDGSASRGRTSNTANQGEIMTTLKMTPRRAAVLRGASEDGNNVNRYRDDKAEKGFRYRVRNLDGDCHRQVKDLLEAKLLKLGTRRLGLSIYSPMPVEITEAGRAALAAWEEGAA